jgi:hypothetical protein
MKSLLVAAALVAVIYLACGEAEQPFPSKSQVDPTGTASPVATPVTPAPPPTPPAGLPELIRACVVGKTSASDAAATLTDCFAADSVQAAAAPADGAADVVLLDVLSNPTCFFTESFVVWRSGGDWKVQSLEPIIPSPDQGTAFAGGNLNGPNANDSGVRTSVVGNIPDLELGLIFLVGGCGSGPQDAFALLALDGDQWALKWDSRDSQMKNLAHTEVQFRGKGIEGLDVRGDSWQLGDAKSQVFHESNPGPHRYFEQTWARQGDEFVLVAESVEPSAYNTLVEFVYRLSTGDSEGARQLTADASLVQTARQLGLVQDPPGQQWLTNLDTETVCCGPIYILEGPPQETLVSFTSSSGKWLISGIQTADYPGYP